MVQTPAKESAAPVPNAAVVSEDELGPSANGDNPVLARVGEREFRGSDLVSLLFFHYPPQGADLLRKLVHDEVVRLETKRLGVTARSEDVESGVREALETLGKQVSLEYAGKKTLEQFLEQDLRTTRPRYEAQLRRFVLARLLFERVLRFEQMQEDRVVCRVVSVGSLEKAQELLAKLREGADFEAIAKQESLAPNREQGGKLPPFGRDYEHPIAKIAFDTPLGGLGGPVEEPRPGGETWFHVLRVIEKIPARKLDPAEAEAEIRKGLLDRPVEDWEYAAWMKRMEKRYSVHYLERP